MKTRKQYPVLNIKERKVSRSKVVRSGLSSSECSRASKKMEKREWKMRKKQTTITYTEIDKDQSAHKEWEKTTFSERTVGYPNR